MKNINQNEQLQQVFNEIGCFQNSFRTLSKKEMNILRGGNNNEHVIINDD